MLNGFLKRRSRFLLALTLLDRHLDDRGDGGGAPREAGPEELLDRHGVLRFDDVEEDMLRICPVPSDHLHTWSIRIEKCVRASSIAGTRFRSVYLRDVK